MATDGFATCFDCGGDLEQWSERDKNTGDRKFWERCPACDKKWSTGVVTKAEYDVLAGVAEPFIKKDEEPLPEEAESSCRKAAAAGLRHFNDVMMRRKLWRPRKQRKRK